MKLYIFDLDGTIANVDHRLHIINPPKYSSNSDWHADWDKFFDECVNDEPNQWIIDLMNIISSSEYREETDSSFGPKVREEAFLLILSGRSDRVRKITEEWLQKFSVPYSGLWMRREGDHRPDEEIKLEILQYFLQQNPHAEVQFIVDDRQKVVDMWRRNGFRCLQCNAWEEAKK